MSIKRVWDMLWTRRGIFSSGTPSDQVTVTTLKASDPRNDLTVEADPIVLDHPVLGVILFLIEAPCPEFIPDEFFAYTQIRAYDVDTADVIPTAYYQHNMITRGYDKR